MESLFKKGRQEKTEHKESGEIQQNLINTLYFKIISISSQFVKGV